MQSLIELDETFEHLQEEPVDDSPVLIEEEMATGKKFDWKWGITTGLVLLSMIVGATLAIWHEFSQIDKHLARVETAVRIIGAKQGADTKTIIDEALTVAANDSNSGRLGNAQAVLSIANKLLVEQKESGQQQPQEEFDKTLAKYKELNPQPSLQDGVRQGLLTLAEYRSDTVPSTDFTTLLFGKMNLSGNDKYIMDSVLIGGKEGGLPVRNDPQGFAIDGFTLTNVVFRNIPIVYHGGPVILHNVRFINCKFVVLPSPHATDLLEAIIQQPANVSLG